MNGVDGGMDRGWGDEVEDDYYNNQGRGGHQDQYYGQNVSYNMVVCKALYKALVVCISRRSQNHNTTV